MPTVTATLLSGNGTPLGVTVRFWLSNGAGLNADGAIVSQGVITADTDPETGELEVVLEPGAWIMNWPNGAAMNRLVVEVPLADGEYDLDDLVTGSPIISSPRVKWYEDIAEMLASDSRLYATAQTRNSYDADGIISGWSRILKTAPESAGLVAGTDNVLESTDGHAFWVRNWIAS